jgi:membrane fusion protein (multidrug efflux system)
MATDVQAGKLHVGPRRRPAAPRSLARRLRLPLMLLAPAAILVGALYWYLIGGRYESTDDSFVKTARISISTDVPGRVMQIFVRDNQPVQAGQPLFRLDDRSYRIAVDQAEAALASARLTVESLKATYQQRLAEQRSAEATFAYASHELERQRRLAASGVSAQAQLDQAVHAAEVARQQVDVARAQGGDALASLGGSADIATDDHPTVKAAAARLDQAKLDLSHTIVLAPLDGTVTKVEQLGIGDYLTNGSSVFYIVAAGRLWIEANFKETQLTYMRPGDRATVTVDTYPGIDFAARVESVSPGTGSAFSLLPPENATGNWVKVTQRLPVRLALEQVDSDHPLENGLSATVEVDTGHERPLLRWLKRHFGHGE